MLPVPLDNAVLIDAVVASCLPSVPALSWPVPDALFLAQLLQVAQASRRKHVHEARDAQTVCAICFPLRIYNDLQIGLGVLRCVGQRGKPAVGRTLVTVGDGDELDIRIGSSGVAQVKEGLLGDWLLINEMRKLQSVCSPYKGSRSVSRRR